MTATHPYLSTFAELVVSHSLQVKPGEHVLVEGIDMAPEVLVQIGEAIRKKGAMPHFLHKHQEVMKLMAETYTDEDYQRLASQELELMKCCQAFIGLRQPEPAIMRNLTSEQRSRILKHYLQPVHYQYRNHHLRWVYFRWPSEHLIASSGMTSTDFTNQYFRATLVDYERFGAAMKPLAELIDKTKEVTILHSNGTNLTFQLGNYGSYVSDGRKNLPDGEVFTAPVKESVEGTITFNIPSTYYGHHFEEVTLRFEQGKVAEAWASEQTDALLSILNTDEGARYIGEFAFGLHPLIHQPIDDILFDEKMYGSIHIALGNAYPVSDNGNRSAIHWDLIQSHRPDSGGGKIIFDGQTIQEDGVFQHPDLQILNPFELTTQINISWNETQKS